MLQSAPGLKELLEVDKHATVMNNSVLKVDDSNSALIVLMQKEFLWYRNSTV